MILQAIILGSFNNFVTAFENECRCICFDSLVLHIMSEQIINLKQSKQVDEERWNEVSGNKYRMCLLCRFCKVMLLGHYPLINRIWFLQTCDLSKYFSQMFNYIL